MKFTLADKVCSAVKKGFLYLKIMQKTKKSIVNTDPTKTWAPVIPGVILIVKSYGRPHMPQKES